MSQPIDVGTVLGGRYKVTSSVLTSAEGDVVLQGIDQVLNRTVSIAVAAAENAEQMTTSAREIATGERYSSVQVLDLGVSDGATYLITNLAEPTDLLDLMVATEGPYVEPFYTDTLGSEIFGESRSREPQTYEDDPEYYAELQDNDRASALGERLPEINLSDRIAGLRSRLSKARGAAAAGMAGAAAAGGAAAGRRNGRSQEGEDSGPAEQQAVPQAQADQDAPDSSALYADDPYATGQYGGDETHDAAVDSDTRASDARASDTGEQRTQAHAVGGAPAQEAGVEDHDVRTTEHPVAEPTPTTAGPAVSDKVTVYEDDDQNESGSRVGGAAAAGAAGAAAGATAGAAARSPQPPAPTGAQPLGESSPDAASEDSQGSAPAGHGAAASRHTAAGLAGTGAAAATGAERAPSVFPVAARNFEDYDAAASAAAGGAGAGAGYADDDEDGSEGGPRWTRLIVGALLGLVLIAGVVFAFNTLGGDDEEPTAGGESTSAEGSPSASESGSTSPSPSPTEPAVEPVATDVERIVPGAQELNSQTDDTLPNLIDGNEASLYRSLSFTQPDFGGFASNMILVVELEEVSDITQIELAGLNGSGGTYEIAVGDSDDFGSAQTITQGSFTGPSVTIPVGSEGEGVEGQYVFFNVTELPELANPYNESRPYGLQLAEFKVS